MNFRKLFQLLRRRAHARTFGISFCRAATFKLPDFIKFNEKLIRLKLPLEDKGVEWMFYEIFLDDLYDLHRFSTLPISKILDIGAHVGLFSVAACVTFPNAMIHAYEPNPALEKYLSNQATQAGFKYFAEAVGYNDGMVSLKQFGQSSGQTRSVIDESGSIPQVSFSKAIERLEKPIDIVKLDCEFAEWSLFEDKEAWQSVKYLTMEYHLWPGYSTVKDVKDVRREVNKLGFTTVKVKPANDYSGYLVAKRRFDS